MKYQFLTCFLLIQSVMLVAPSQEKADEIIGIWLTGGKEPAKIQIFKSRDKFYGRIVWLQNPTTDGKPRADVKNPDKNRRDQPILGQLILTGVIFDGDDEWDHGRIYDPESGKTYKCYISLSDKNTIKIRGYVGMSLFGRTETWAKTTL